MEDGGKDGLFVLLLASWFRYFKYSKESEAKLTKKPSLLLLQLVFCQP